MLHLRSDARERLKRKLEAGRSLHMPAPRRIGKTWTIGRLAGDLREAGWLVIEIDVEGLRTPHAFARELCQRIEAQVTVRDRFVAHAQQRLQGMLGGGWGDKPLDALGRVDPIEFAETLIASLDHSTNKAAILVDEISYFVLALAEHDASEARAFAYKLRAFVQRYKTVRWLITGAIGLDTIARRYGLEGAFVDFETFVLEPFTKAQALSYMRDPAIQQQFNHVFDAADGDFETMFDELGWLAPYYLMMIANEVRPSGGQVAGKQKATRADFEAAFEKLLQPNRRSDFAVWHEHVSKNLPAPDRAIARRLLGKLSQNADGEKEDALVADVVQVESSATLRQVRDILAMLSNDGLLTSVGDRYRFQSGLVRRYWQQHEAD